MCGITGTYNLPIDNRSVEAACKAMFHRGPDSEGFYHKGKVNLGMRRLSIIDISNGSQPIYNADKTLCIVFNGEIFNYKELREELKAKGHSFYTQSDTEVILHTYAEWGEDCPKYLRGQFAFAIHDLRSDIIQQHGPEGILFIARDHLGIIPLYYSYLNNGIVFASELKAILATELVERKLNQASVVRYLQWGFVPGPETIIENINLLEAAHSLVVNQNGINKKRYWSLAYNEQINDKKDKFGENYTTVVSRVKEHLIDAVESRMIADVQVGAFLSGGLDSSVVVALMSHARDRHKQEELHTFSINFKENAYNESFYAELLAKKYNTFHHSCLVTSEDVLAEFPNFISCMDQPTIDGLNTYFVSKFVHQYGIKVAVSGLGGDEIFGGYPSFSNLPKMYKMMNVAKHIPGASSVAANFMKTTNYSGQRRKTYEALKSNGSIEELYAVQRGLFLHNDGIKLLSQIPNLNSLKLLKEVLKGVPNLFENMGKWHKVSLLETNIYMQQQLLRDSDNMAMSHSLEIRVPLIDHLLLEFMARVPEEYKRQSHRVKELLADAVDELIPHEISTRSKKGFAFPLEEWMLSTLLPIMHKELIDDISNIFNGDNVRNIWGDFVKRKCNYTRPWSLAILSLWLKENKIDL